MALPVIFAGALLRMFGRGRWQSLGRALAGFGVIFLGIDFMQQGMHGFAETMTPERFPPDSIGSRLLLVGLGIVVTLVTQSSSAGVAIAMTALSVGAINFPQAASMVIGMDVGTTVTALVASLGSSQAARRTGLSHTIFNLFSAVGALLLLDVYVWLIDAWRPAAVAGSPELALVGFHTLFNAAALVFGLLLARPFARLMETLVPERGISLARRLDHQLVREPVAATAALEATLRDLFDYLLDRLGRLLIGQDAEGPVPTRVVEQDFRDTRDFLDALNAAGEKGKYQARIGSAMHALDHLQRMFWRVSQNDRVEALLGDERLVAETVELRTLCAEIRSSLETGIDLTG